MPTFLKLDRPAASQVACAHKLTDTQCVTESGTYNFTRVFGPDKPLHDALSQASVQLNTTSSESMIFHLGCLEHSVAAVIESIVRPHFGEQDISVSAAELMDDDLADLASPKACVKLVQDDDAVYRVRGWTSGGYEEGIRLLESRARAVRIVELSSNSRKVMVIELPINGDTGRIWRSMQKLVALLAESTDYEKTYFPYRDSVLTKLLWARLFCAPNTLNVVLCCSLGMSELTRLLQLGDQFTAIMARGSGKHGSLRPPLKVGGGDLKHELEALSELVRKVKQRRADAHAAQYAERLNMENKRAVALEQERKVTLRTLESKLASFEAEYRRKASALDYDRRQDEERKSEKSATSHHRCIMRELESASATLEACEKELQSNKAALAAALSLTPEERSRGNIRQAEYNLQSLKAQCKHLIE